MIEATIEHEEVTIELEDGEIDAVAGGTGWISAF